jgi:hypothetical protein
MAVKSKANPMLTKTGKTRLGPLNLKQLTDLIEKTSKAKDKSKIQRRIAELTKRQGITVPVKTAEAQNA